MHSQARYYHVATRFLPCCYHVARYVGPTGDREHPACAGGWLGFGGAQSRRDCITQPGVARRALPRVTAPKRPPTRKGLYRCLPHPSPFLQPSPREVALQVLAALDILVRFEVECATGADKNVRAPIAQLWENPRCAPAEDKLELPLGAAIRHLIGSAVGSEPENQIWQSCITPANIRKE